MVHTFRAVPEVVPHQRGKCDWLKPISERCNLSLFTAAERGVFDSRPDNTGEPLNSFVWLASIQACEPCPTQSAAIVTMRIRQQLCESLQCYMDIRSPSLFFRFCSPSLFTPSFFLCYNPLILCSMRTLFSVLRPSLPHFLLLFLSSRALCPIALCPPLLLCVFMSLSRRHLVSFPWLVNHFALLMFEGAPTLTANMKVYLSGHEQLGGTNRNHRPHNMPMSPGWGLKPQQRGIIFFFSFQKGFNKVY